MIDFWRCNVLLTDLDNTLYDWMGYFVPAFRAMVVNLSKETGIDVGTLMTDFATVYRRHGSVEYSFAIEELETLARLHPELTPNERVNKYWDAVVSFQRLRRQKLRPYQGVQGMLSKLCRAGVGIFAVTEGLGWHIGARLRSLKIDSYFSGVYVCNDHVVPPEVSLEQIRRTPVENYQTTVELRYIPKGLHKPDPKFLEWILSDLHIDPSEAAYLGDSLDRDISMAKLCGVRSIWARYGTYTNLNDLRTLLKVTHRTKAELDRASGRDCIPSQPDLVVDSPMDVLKAFWLRFDVESPLNSYGGFAVARR